MPITNLQTLPPEILSQCFANLVNPFNNNDIKALRLTSRYCHDASSPLFLDFTHVYMNSESLARLEDLSRHPVFSKSIRSVQFHLCFYDELLAKDQSLFAECRAAQLAKLVGSQYRRACVIEAAVWAFGNPVPECLTAWGNREALKQAERDGTAAYHFLRDMHKEYCLRFDDQESIKHDGSLVRRLGKALSRFSCIRSITLVDEDDRRSCREGSSNPFSTSSMTQLCLQASSWKGTNCHVMGGKPPVEMITSLFETLQSFGIAPAEFRVQINLPDDLSLLSTTRQEQRQVLTMLRRSTPVYIFVWSLGREDSLAAYSVWPHDEIIHLGNLTTAFFSSNALHTLALSFDECAISGTTPQLSLGEMLSPRTWPSVERISLCGIPIHQQEFEELVKHQRSSVRKLDLHRPYLLSGSWADCLDMLTRLDNLDHFACSSLMGGEFGDKDDFNCLDLGEEIGDYVLNHSTRNPLRHLS